MLAERRQQKELAPLYTQVHENTDSALHIREAAAWLARAQDSGNDRGVAYGTPFGEDFPDKLS